VGSGDIMVNNRFLFEDCDYQGNDVIKSPKCYDCVKKQKKKIYHFPDNYFDTIYQPECLKHDPEYKNLFKNI